MNWAVGPAVYGTLWLGHPMRTLVQMLRDALPAGILMVALGAVTIVLSPALGLAALALFAFVAVLPQSALTFAARTRPVAGLDPLTATRRYGNALAIQLRLDRPARKELDEVIRLAHRARSPASLRNTSGTRSRTRRDLLCGRARRRSRGTAPEARGDPSLIIPRSARIAAVARTWAALTAQGSPMLGHREALSHLEAAAGVRLDPAIVHAARVVVAQERTSELEPAPEPRLHRLHVPTRLRRVLASGA